MPPQQDNEIQALYSTPHFETCACVKMIWAKGTFFTFRIVHHFEYDPKYSYSAAEVCFPGSHCQYLSKREYYFRFSSYFATQVEHIDRCQYRFEKPKLNEKSEDRELGKTAAGTGRSTTCKQVNALHNF